MIISKLNVLIFFLFVFTINSSTVFGSEILVTTIIDEDDGMLGGGNGISLREAVNYSTEGDSILLPIGIYDLSSELDVTKGLIIIGSSPNTLQVNELSNVSWDRTIIQTSTAASSANHRIFNVSCSSFGFHLKNMTLRHSKEEGSVVYMTGGAGQNITLDYVHIEQNIGDSPILIDGNIDTLRITNSILRNNSSIGGTFNDGGAVNDEQSSFLEITDCIFQSNEADLKGGAIFRSGSSKIYNCSFLQNELFDTGGDGSVSAGGAIYYSYGNHEIANCTFMKGFANRAGGIFDESPENSILMMHCTFLENTANEPGWALITSTTSSNEFVIINSIFTDNGEGNIAHEYEAPAIAFSVLSDENIDIDPSWSYSSKSIYVGIKEGSSVLDGGTSEYGSYILPSHDQLGNPRSATPDIGSIEKVYNCSTESIIFQHNANGFAELYTADYALVDSNGWTHYCNAGGNIMLSLDTVGTGTVVLPSKVTLQTSNVLVKHEDLPSFGSLMDPYIGGLYSKWMWNVKSEEQALPPDSLKLRSYVHLNLYQKYVTESPNFYSPSTITSIEDINAYVSNNLESTFLTPANGSVDGHEIVSGKMTTTTTFTSGVQAAGYFQEYFVPVLNSGGTFTHGGVLRNRWTGMEDDNWNNINNWSEDYLPDLDQHVIIPDQVPHDPIVKSLDSARCKSLHLQCFSSIVLEEDCILDVQLGAGTDVFIKVINGIRMDYGSTISVDSSAVVNIIDFP